MENESSKHFFSLDREEYSGYTSEKEVLLQAGLTALVKSVEYDEDQDLTIFNLYISEKNVRAHHRRQTLTIAVPIVLYIINMMSY